MIELISAAKVGNISETDVSLPEKVVSNQEKCQVPWQTCMPGTCPLADFFRKCLDVYTFFSIFAK